MILPFEIITVNGEKKILDVQSGMTRNYYYGLAGALHSYCKETTLYWIDLEPSFGKVMPREYQTSAGYFHAPYIPVNYVKVVVK